MAQGVRHRVGGARLPRSGSVYGDVLDGPRRDVDPTGSTGEVLDPRMTGMSELQRRSEPELCVDIEQASSRVEVGLILVSQARGLVQELDLGAQIRDSLSLPQDLSEREGDSWVALVAPEPAVRLRVAVRVRVRVRVHVHEDDVELPRIPTARTQPEVVAARAQRRAIGDEGAERAPIRGPHVETAPDMFDQSIDIRSGDAGVDIAVGSGDAGERLDRPAAGDPPASRVPLEQRHRIGGRACSPGAVQSHDLLVIHPLNVPSRA